MWGWRAPPWGRVPRPGLPCPAEVPLYLRCYLPVLLATGTTLAGLHEPVGWGVQTPHRPGRCQAPMSHTAQQWVLGCEDQTVGDDKGGHDRLLKDVQRTGPPAERCRGMPGTEPEVAGLRRVV